LVLHNIADDTRTDLTAADHAALDFSARSPRLRPQTREIVFLSVCSAWRYFISVFHLRMHSVPALVHMFTPQTREIVLLSVRST
jgi:hypothetical protein